MRDHVNEKQCLEEFQSAQTFVSLCNDSLSRSAAAHRRCLLDCPDAADRLDVDRRQVVQVIETNDVELGEDNLKHDELSRTILTFFSRHFQRVSGHSN